MGDLLQQMAETVATTEQEQPERLNVANAARAMISRMTGSPWGGPMRPRSIEVSPGFL